MNDLPGLQHLDHLQRTTRRPPGPRPLSLAFVDPATGEWQVAFDADLGEADPSADAFKLSTDAGPLTVAGGAQSGAGLGQPRVLRVFAPTTPANPTGGRLVYTARGGLTGADGMPVAAFEIRQ